jgi:deaminated glutathione amidase
MTHPKIAAVQLEPTESLIENLNQTALLIKKAAQELATLVVLPEMFPIGGNPNNKLMIKEPFGQGPVQSFLSEQAIKNNVWIVGGTIPIEIPGSSRTKAACLVYNNCGEMVARYDKIHLFDAIINDEPYRESEQTEAGDQITILDTPIGKLGLAVCYDLRFPELFRNLMNQGAEIVAIPCAFTLETGKAHFDILCRCRAIENQIYLVAACQTGGITDKKNHGHSMVVSPWGNALVSLSNEIGTVTTEIDLPALHALRKRMPISEHQRIFKTAAK